MESRRRKKEGGKRNDTRIKEKTETKKKEGGGLLLLYLDNLTRKGRRVRTFEIDLSTHVSSIRQPFAAHPAPPHNTQHAHASALCAPDLFSMAVEGSHAVSQCLNGELKSLEQAGSPLKAKHQATKQYSTRIYHSKTTFLTFFFIDCCLFYYSSILVMLALFSASTLLEPMFLSFDLYPCMYVTCDTNIIVTFLKRLKFCLICAN